ncbi:hypothetical protein SK128_006987 [Halocaridina rubra]|uniref:PCNA-interacting partner n=1 Tax=Halocaridina rubra TaxID=373956 RepID=A0AAN8WH56_HALRR
MYKANSASVLCDEELSQIESRMTKAFFIPYIEKPAQRQLVVQRVQDIISKDNPALAKIIHLGHCGWENVGHVQSPTYFAMFLCRKYNLLPSERCVLLSFNDQYHAIQLRLAKINKEKNGDFSAAASDVLDVWNQLCRDSVSYNKTFSKLSHSPYNDDGCDDLKLPSSQQQSYDPVEREMQSVVSSYQEFMENSACIDHFTAYALLRECMNSSREMINELTSRIYIIEGASHMPAMEREILKLFLSRAKVIEVSVSCPVSTSFSSDLNMSGINEEPLNLSHLAEAVNDQNHIDKESQIAAVSTSENEEVNSSQSEQTHCYPSRGEEISVKIDQLDSTSASYLADLSEMLCTSELSESELYIEQLIISYLRLLINTRDELALAVLCSMPGREISQQGFHDIKAEAQKKNMPMFQVGWIEILYNTWQLKIYGVPKNCTHM